MDYHSLHGPGISNFDNSSSPHRMPTVSAAQALQELESSQSRCISTDVDSFHGGVSRGKVTEIYGPPGVGKTALGMQLAASTLYGGNGVIWVDTSHPVPGPRLFRISSSYRPSISTSSSDKLPPNPNDLLDNLIHITAPTLSHLIALLAHSTPNFPPEKTGLIVIDSFSSLVANAFPRTVESSNTTKKPGVHHPASRKFPIIQYLINALQKLAATRNIAIVVISQCITKMRPGLGAALVPAVSAPAWEQGLACRVVLFRDWAWEDDEGKSVGDVRLAEVIKAEGIGVHNLRRAVVGFTIHEDGLASVSLPNLPSNPSPSRTAPPASKPAPQVPQKRKFASTDLEIPDSDCEDDEDYGWAEEDEMPAMPPQWQGSEDILISPHVESEPLEPEEPDDVEEDVAAREAEYERVIEDSEDELA